MFFLVTCVALKFIVRRSRQWIKCAMARTNPQGNIATVPIKIGNDIWGLLNSNKDEN